MPVSNHRTSSQSIQWKVIALVLVTAATMLVAMIWKTESLLVQDKTAFIMDSAMKQIAPLKRLVQQRLRDEKESLIHFASVRVGQGGSARNASFAGFDVVSLVQAGDGGQWVPTWIEKNPNVTEDRWPKGHELTLLKSLSYGKVRDGETVWTRLSDRQGAPIYAFMISVEIQKPVSPNEETALSQTHLPDTAEQVLASMNMANKAVLVGFTTSNPLAEVTEDFIGSTNSVYLVDDRGYVAAHVNKAYQGALFTEDPLVREILKNKKTGSTGKFEDLESRPVLGHYERVEHSNLYAIITTPEQMLYQMVDAQRNSAIQIGLAALLFCLGLGAVASWLIARSSGRAAVIDSPVVEALPQAEEVVAVHEAPEVAAPETLPEPTEQVEARVRTETEKILTDGLVQALTEPLHGILGHASLVRVKSGEDEIQNHADSIAREARRMRDTLERIHDWQDQAQAEAEVEKVDVRKAIENALSNAETELVSEGVHVMKEVRPVPYLRGSQARIENALSRLIDNAIEAMQARPSKHLKFETDFDGEMITIRVTDTGIGMPRDVRDRAFEPFFKGFESPNRVGLGLASVASVVKAFGGTHEIETVPGEGSTFTFKFQVAEEEKSAFRVQENREFAQIVHPVEEPAVIQEEPPVEPVIEAAPAAQTETAIAESAPEDDDDLKIEVIEPQIFASLIKEDFVETDSTPSQSPAPVPEAIPGPLMLDELDDEDEIFANVSLSKAATRLTKVGQIQPPKAPVATVAEIAAELAAQPGPTPVPRKKKAAEVKIRKPKVKDDSPQRG